MRNILFYAQNNGQVSNVRLLLDELKQRDYLVSIYDTSKIYYQPINFDGFADVLLNSIDLGKSFYRCSLLERVKGILKAQKYLKSIVDSFDILIVAADGAFERILIREFQKQRKKTTMIVDGVISDYSLSFVEVIIHPSYLTKYIIGKIKNKVFNLFKSTAVSPFIPSQVGMMPIDKILVIGEHSKRCIEKINHHSEIIASGMPRLYNQHINRTFLKNTGPYYICYFPSAFKWHHNLVDDVNQHADISSVCSIISEIRNEQNFDIRLVIKMHPRESILDYKVYTNQYDFVEVVCDGSITDCFQKYDLFLSNVSTVIIEGIINNINVYSLMIHFEYWRYKNSFLATDDIKKIFNIVELRNLVLACCKGENCISIETERSSNLIERNCSPYDVVQKLLA